MNESKKKAQRKLEYTLRQMKMQYIETSAGLKEREAYSYKCIHLKERKSQINNPTLYLKKLRKRRGETKLKQAEENKV